MMSQFMVLDQDIKERLEEKQRQKYLVDRFRSKQKIRQIVTKPLPFHEFLGRNEYLVDRF